VRAMQIFFPVLKYEDPDAELRLGDQYVMAE
jgi:hypothetical protein